MNEEKYVVYALLLHKIYIFVHSFESKITQIISHFD